MGGTGQLWGLRNPPVRRLPEGGGGGDRRGLWTALGLALVVQGPLGWWLLRAIGTARFLRVWATGIAARVAVVGLTALVLVRALGLPPEATLFSLVGLLVALLGVEAVAVLPGRSGPEVR